MSSGNELEVIFDKYLECNSLEKGKRRATGLKQFHTLGRKWHSFMNIKVKPAGVEAGRAGCPLLHVSGKYIKEDVENWGGREEESEW